jgi:hypothetical protein
MRRWFEFGWDGNFAAPEFQYRSNTKQIRRGEAGDLPPIFISMPYKQTLLEILQGTSLHDVEPFSCFPALIRYGGSTASPDPGCSAEHVVNGANTYGWRIDSFYTGGFWQMLIGGFPKPGGGFTPNILQQSLEPPSENG